MKVSEYIVSRLVKDDVTDAFGVPGGVILKLLYAMEENSKIVPHLMTNEQSAGFAACGYAQASGKLGVAYATRGPGITNMMTCIAEAYQESLPVIFITAHGKRTETKTRFEDNQELEIVNSVLNITKYAVSIDEIETVSYEIDKACKIALDERKGPVLVDILSSLYDKEIEKSEISDYTGIKKNEAVDCSSIIDKVKESIEEAKRPIILIGDGIRNLVSPNEMEKFSENLKIPIISSRGSQDILMQSQYYYGYIGSHGTRYSNFILSKTDLIIVLGNRLAFPLKSESYAPVIEKVRMIRFDIDENEFTREIKNADNYKIDVKELIEYVVRNNIIIETHMDWIEVCDRLKEELEEYDKPEPVKRLEKYFRNQNSEKVYVVDVGNNEFFSSRAIEAAHPKGMMLCSKTYGTLGVALGRAIGAYYATKKEVICIMGDQGFQYNTQDLQYIARHKLPIDVVVLNNRSSGMIADHEHQLFGEKFVHVNENCDYFVPDLALISKAYGFCYRTDCDKNCEKQQFNILYEIKYPRDISLVPNLPKGNVCQNMEPLMENDKYTMLDQI